MNLTKQERETIYIFNEAEAQAEVSTYNRSLAAKLAALAHDRPDECVEVRPLGPTENDVPAEYQFPKKWLKIHPSRVLSDEQRAALADRMRNLRSESKI